ncbi:DUF3857 and transglutaminase domain-containing protein [Marinomonas sp. C2222]|uniref:DUF3857 and transglutaminase domain-containing protein n=1 Tax=Marinomonas sargassi TaxID=2984494 RepID=A0ABT2YVI5_9GAMM|nr:DUF3857 domain-containing protein [Marinomonas sargassi]MCV2403790.1 DUF3857 and transglutaminase domain-containing protein [Marinomonas sargassi]
MKQLINHLFLFITFFISATQVFANNIQFALHESPLIKMAKQDQINNPQGYDSTTNILRSIDVKIDGDLVTTHIQQIWYYPDSKSADTYGTERIYFNEINDQITVYSAASINSNHAVNQLNIETVQYGEDNNYNTFDDQKVAYLPIPGIVERSYMVIDYRVTTDYSKMEMPFYDSFSVEGNFLVKSFKANIQWNKQDIQWHNTHTGLTCQSAEKSLKCTGNNIAPLDIDSSTYWRDKIRGLRVAAHQDWPDVIDRMANAYQQAFTEQTLIDDLYNELTKDLTTKTEIIDALFRYVSEQIRYVSLSTEGHAYTPHSNDSVISNLFGDCKDKTALLQALLKKAGIESTPHLVATNRTNTQQLTVPSAAYFNHIVLCLNYIGKEYCLDPTDMNTHWQTTSDWIQNKVALALRADERPKQIAPSEYLWQMEVNTDLTFTTEGGVLEKQKRTYIGEFASYMRNELRGQTKEEQHEWLKEQYQQNIADIETVKTGIISGFEGDYSTFMVGSSLSFEPFLSTDTHLVYTEPDNWLASELRMNKLENEFDAYTFNGVKYTSHYTIDISSHWTPIKPSPRLSLSSKFGELKRDSYIKNNTLYIETTLTIPWQRIELSDQVDFNKFIEVLRELQAIRVEAPLHT